jgi:hypothetical protein
LVFDPPILLGADQVGSPVEPLITEPGGREALPIGSGLNGFDPLQVLGLADAGEGQCYLPKPEELSPNFGDGLKDQAAT